MFFLFHLISPSDISPSIYKSIQNLLQSCISPGVISSSLWYTLRQQVYANAAHLIFWPSCWHFRAKVNRPPRNISLDIGCLKCFVKSTVDTGDPAMLIGWFCSRIHQVTCSPNWMLIPYMCCTQALKPGANVKSKSKHNLLNLIIGAWMALHLRQLSFTQIN